MKLAITVVAFAEILALFASAIALLVFAAGKLVRNLRSFIRPEEDLGPKGSGLAAVHAVLAQLGMRASEEDALKIAAAAQSRARASKRAVISHAEFRDLARSVLERAAA